MKDEKILTTHDRELIVLASMINANTADATAKAAKAAEFDPAEMFTDPEARDNFDVFRQYGADVFDGHLGGRRLDELATPNVKGHIARIVTEYRRKKAEDEYYSEQKSEEKTPPAKDAAQWLSEPDDPDNPLIENLVECGSLVAIVGPAKATKSWLSMIIAVCIATGRDFYGRSTARRRVYYANIEIGAKQAKKRLRSICKGMGIDPNELTGWLFIDNQRGTNATWKRCFFAAKEVAATVAIIDPFYQVFKGEERNEADCLMAVEDMKRFLHANITLFVVFHAPKGYAGDRQIVDMISGSSVLVRFPENVIAILPHATDKAARVIDCSVLRDYAPADPFCVKFEDGTLKLASDITPQLKQSRFQPNSPKSANQSERADKNRRVRDAFFAAALEVANEAGDALLDSETFRNRLIGKPGGAVSESPRSAKFLSLWKEAISEGGILRAQRKQERKPNGTVGNSKVSTLLVSTPERIAAYLDQFNTLGI